MNEHDRNRDRYSAPERKHLETATEARQATLGRPVLYVLIGGLALGALYLIGTQIWNVAEQMPADEITPPAVSAAPPVPLATPEPLPAAPATP